VTGKTVLDPSTWMTCELNCEPVPL
jgi:hypothetical protein